MRRGLVFFSGRTSKSGVGFGSMGGRMTPYLHGIGRCPPAHFGRRAGRRASSCPWQTQVLAATTAPHCRFHRGCDAHLSISSFFIDLLEAPLASPTVGADVARSPTAAEIAAAAAWGAAARGRSPAAAADAKGEFGRQQPCARTHARVEANNHRKTTSSVVSHAPNRPCGSFGSVDHGMVSTA